MVLRGLVAVGCVLTLYAQAQGAFPMRSLSSSAPIGPGSSWVSLDFYPTINEDGQALIGGVARQAGFPASERHGVWIDNGSGLTALALEGNPLPNFPDRIWQDPFTAKAQVDDVFNYTGIYTNPNATTGFATFAYDSGTHLLLAASGDPAPGTAIAFSGVASAAANRSFQYAMLASVTGPGVDTTNTSGVWANTDGNLQLLARNGSQAPMLPDGVLVSNLGNPSINPAGMVLVRGSLKIGSGGVDDTNARAYWMRVGSTNSVSVREGEAIGSSGLSLRDPQFRTPRLNAAGEYAFNTLLSGATVTPTSDAAIVKVNGTTKTIIARTGDPAPNGGVFTSFFSSNLTDNGRIIFDGITTGGTSGIFIATESSITRLIGKDSPVPSRPDASFNTIYEPTVSPRGQIAFIADLILSGQVSYDHLFATDPSGTLHYIAGFGSVLQTPTGEIGPITRAHLYSRNFQDIERAQFNAHGQLVFDVSFADTNHLPIIITVPEPAGILPAMGLILLSLRVRKLRAASHHGLPGNCSK
jgi:hypothetical protein